MPTSVEELAARAVDHSADDRPRLADRLPTPLPAEPDAEVDAAWNIEIQRRIADVHAGTARVVPAEEVHDVVQAIAAVRSGYLGVSAT